MFFISWPTGHDNLDVLRIFKLNVKNETYLLLPSEFLCHWMITVFIHIYTRDRLGWYPGWLRFPHSLLRIDHHVAVYILTPWYQSNDWYWMAVVTFHPNFPFPSVIKKYIYLFKCLSDSLVQRRKTLLQKPSSHQPVLAVGVFFQTQACLYVQVSCHGAGQQEVETPHKT